MHPIEQNHRETALAKMRCGLAQHQLRGRVAAEAGVLKNEFRARRHNERRIRDDEIKLLVADRIEEIAFDETDVFHAVQARVQARKINRSWIRIRRQDALRVAGSEQRVRARAGAKIECGLDLPAHSRKASVRVEELAPLITKSANGASQRGGKSAKRNSPSNSSSRPTATSPSLVRRTSPASIKPSTLTGASAAPAALSLNAAPMTKSRISPCSGRSPPVSRIAVTSSSTRPA